LIIDIAGVRSQESGVRIKKEEENSSPPLLLLTTSSEFKTFGDWS
jgi:hypothetical protein